MAILQTSRVDWCADNCDSLLTASSESKWDDGSIALEES